jgi:hypothetical protein
VFWVLCFLSLMGYVMQARSLNQSQQKGGLWAVFDSFGPYDRFQLKPVFAYYHTVQGGQMCHCFCQVATTKAGQLLPAQGGALSFVPCSQSHKISLLILHAPALGDLLLALPLLSEFLSLPSPCSLCLVQCSAPNH